MTESHHPPSDQWTSGLAYEPYVGRWSRLVARQFLPWLAVPANSQWLDVGCGTGILSQAILEGTDPRHVKGIDQSAEFVTFAQNAVRDPRVDFEVGDAQALPVESGAVDAAVSALMLNFVPQPERAVAEMARVTRPGGKVALYLWDYAGKMDFMRYFWEAAAALDPQAAALDEGRRFSVCNPGELTRLFQAAGLDHIDVRAIDIDTHFRDFDDYWSPFLGGQGPAPRYAMSLSEDQRAALRERLRDTLPVAPDHSIPLVARAWAIAGTP